MRKRTLSLALAVSMAAMSLAGCGGGGTTATTAAAGGETTAAASEAATEAATQIFRKWKRSLKRPSP